uniref:zinc finger protein 385B-like n=1 Tax=Doryrhamphus excisus TaxID=161450 RepID=UPI0025ADAE6A|nr:zinc finger protein 385B-like [Doryrhamphus excisus]
MVITRARADEDEDEGEEKEEEEEGKERIQDAGGPTWDAGGPTWDAGGPTWDALVQPCLLVRTNTCLGCHESFECSPDALGPFKRPMSPRTSVTEKEVKSIGTAWTNEEVKAKRLLCCSLCKVVVNSASQLQAHNSGSKHRTMLEARSGDGAIKSFPRHGAKAKPPSTEPWSGLQNKTFHCEICDVHVNSDTQLKQHISSRRHKDRAAGKPAKPKFNPYSPSQRPSSLHMVSHKNQDRIKPASSTTLLRRQQLTTAASSLPSFHVHAAAHASPALCQAPPLLQALMYRSSPFVCSTSLLFHHD